MSDIKDGFQCFFGDETDAKEKRRAKRPAMSDAPKALAISDCYPFKFRPEPDITVYELAQILASANMEITKKVYRKLDSDLQRHFEASDE